MTALTRLEQLRELAMDQNGFVTTKQALGEGLSNASLATLVSRGRLHHVAHDVYRVPQVAETSLDQFQLAVLWTGAPEACLSHETALAVRGIGDSIREASISQWPAHDESDAEEGNVT